MKIVASCSHCGHLFRIEDIFEGVDLPCPKCGETTVIKAMAGMDDKGLPVFEPALDTILDKIFSGEATAEDMAKLRAIGASISLKEKKSDKTPPAVNNKKSKMDTITSSPQTPLSPEKETQEHLVADRKPPSRQGFRVRLDDSKVIRPPTDIIKRPEYVKKESERDQPPIQKSSTSPQPPVAIPDVSADVEVSEVGKRPAIRMTFLNRKNVILASAVLCALVLVIVVWSLISAAAEYRRERNEAFSSIVTASRAKSYEAVVRKGKVFLERYRDDDEQILKTVKGLVTKAEKELEAQRKLTEVKSGLKSALGLKELRRIKDDLTELLVLYRGTDIEEETEQLLKKLNERIVKEKDEVEFTVIKGLLDKGRYAEADVRLRSFAPTTDEFRRKKEELSEFLKDYNEAALSLLNLSKNADAKRDYDKAVESLEAIIRKYPYSRYAEEARMLIPILRDKRRRYKRRRFEELLSYGKRKLAVKEWEEAKRALEEASKFNPGDPDLIGLLALAREKERKYRNMVFIPEGWFIMGSDTGAPDESPRHKVRLKAFYISKYPVTNREYKEFIDATNYPVPFVDAKWAEPYNWDKKKRTYPEGKADHPVVLVSFYDALAYCKWAGKRLPTEAEWEKAMRGQDGRKYPWGDAPPTKNLANYGRSYKGTTKVGSLPAGVSPYGVLDGAGNIWEWVQDYYQKDFYRTSEHKIDPVCRRKSVERVKRGGSWVDDADDLRCSNRSSSSPSEKLSIIGFRVAMDAEE